MTCFCLVIKKTFSATHARVAEKNYSCALFVAIVLGAVAGVLAYILFRPIRILVLPQVLK